MEDRHLVIAGEGAAGLFAAGAARSLGHRVTLVQKTAQPGKKLLITGKGRCNLTNNCDEAEFLKGVRRNPKFLYSAVYGLPPAMVMDLFENQLDLPLKTERGRRVFPQSDRAQDVLNALRRYAAGTQFVRGTARQVLANSEGAACGLLLEGGGQVQGDAVLLATGGLSYPGTGSTGDGYKMARQAGHSIVPTAPSLVALVEKGDLCRDMAGLSLKNVGLRLLENGKAVYSEQGEMLFTHFGLSGPMVLSASAYTGDFTQNSYEVSIDLKPALSEEKLDERIRRDFEEMANRDAAHCMDKLLPNSLRPVMLGLWGVDPVRKVNQITREERLRLGRLVKDFRVPLSGRGDYQHAVITAGGVDVKEVEPRTMQSKKMPGLYFAGEILDVDGYTGGYNLHIAWATAWAAANSI